MVQSADLIYQVVSRIEPHDRLEREHQQDVLAWIDSGAQLFRITKPDHPPKHLVSYFVVHDELHNKLLLINHLTSGLMLPTGGHIEEGEDPRTAVVREAREELGMTAHFGTKFGGDPFFVTVCRTIGQGNHIDVSLWYIIKGDSRQTYAYEAREMNGYTWLSPHQVLRTDRTKLDPNMHRFVRKMQTFGTKGIT